MSHTLPPDLVAAIEHGRAHPEEAVEINLPPVADTDWEAVENVGWEIVEDSKPS